MAQIAITDQIAIDEKALHFDFIRASGPGGQNVNKVSTAVQLRFDVQACPDLSADVCSRLLKLAGKKINSEGMLVIEARRYRTQEKNRQDALERLAGLLEKASRKPRPRIRTRPSLASKERKISAKKHRSRIKTMRRAVVADRD